jgi:hypothetical protein
LTVRGSDLAEFLSVEMEPPAAHAMEKYAEEYFNLNRKGIFGKKTTVSKILSWKNVSRER